MLQAWSARSPICALMRVNCSLLMAMILVLEPVENARAEELVIQNDSLTDGSDAAYQAGFQAGDIGAAVFELPEGVDAFRIDKVQVLFLAPTDEVLDTIVNVHLYCGGPPNPGLPIQTIEATNVFPGLLNQLEPGAVGQNWIVQRVDGQFSIGVEYLWALGGAISPTTGHLGTDADTCESGKNLVYEVGTASWFDPCLYDAPGNFVIRLVGEPFASRAPFGDSDDDGDVDQEDFGVFQECYTGEFGVATPQCAAAFDCDGDGDIDLADHDHFVACASGPLVPADPGCGSCLPTGLCAAVSLRSILSARLDGQDGARFPWLWAIVVGIVVILGLSALYYLYSSAVVTSKRNTFTTQSNAYSPSTDDWRTLQQAIDHLRNVWGTNADGTPDQRARDWGNEMSGGGYGTKQTPDCCKVWLVRHNENTTGLDAATPVNNPLGLIFIDDFYLNAGFDVQTLALIMYAEYQHIKNPGLLTDRRLQGELMDFRRRHNIVNVSPKIRHGLPEGIAEED